jgi:hypothetical protein
MLAERRNHDSFILKRQPPVKTSAKAVLFTLLLGAPAVPMWANGTYTAASCNQADVNAVINGPTHTAVDGDVIQIPAGSCTWTTGITVPTHIGITISGAGTPNSTAATVGASSSCTQTSITVAGGIVAFRATPTYGNSTMRLSCMSVAPGTGSSTAASILGTCTSSGCPSLRMDNLTFPNWVGHTSAAYAVTVAGDMFGVVDHNTLTGVPAAYLQLMELSHASYLGVGYWGDNAWAQPEDYGTAKFLFFENNTFNNAGCCEDEVSAGTLENEGGTRAVARYNHFTIMDNLNVSLTWHGTETSGRPRSGRAYEYYGNTWSCDTINGCPPSVGVRGGTGLVWGNTFSATAGSFFSTILYMPTYRTVGNPNSTWGPCDGSSPYDSNDGTAYWSGSIGSVSGSNPYTITVSGTSPGWTSNQWSPNGAPYSIHDITRANGGEIASNGANTLTTTWLGGPGAWVPIVGDSIQILRATVCIDQAGGRGAGLLYNPSIPANTISANAVPSPTYLWMNSASPAPGAVAAANTARVIQNRDFYMEAANQSAQTSTTMPFDGTKGMGHGTLANRPGTCTTGVAYWATDQNTLYQCRSTNAWTSYYTPYSYPHPLITGGAPISPTAPSSPTNLQTMIH